MSHLAYHIAIASVYVPAVDDDVAAADATAAADAAAAAANTASRLPRAAAPPRRRRLFPLHAISVGFMGCGVVG